MIICEDIFAIFIYTDIAMMLKLQYSFNKWDSSIFAFTYDFNKDATIISIPFLFYLKMQ